MNMPSGYFGVGAACLNYCSAVRKWRQHYLHPNAPALNNSKDGWNMAALLVPLVRDCLQ